MTKALAVYSSVDSPGRKDATGAFAPEAKAFSRLHSAVVVPIDCIGNGKSVRFRQLMQAIHDHGDGLELLALFCHGWSNGIQFGVSMAQVDELAQRIASSGVRPDLRIALYACSTADADNDDDVRVGPATDGGFADRLRDGLVAHGLEGGWIDAHKTAGHCSQNPFVVRFDVEAGRIGGEWLVQSHGPYWQQWIRALQGKGDLRLRFSTMTREQVIAEIRYPLPN